MAVEIPVVIDIEKAFEEAAAKVGKALRPLQETLSKDALNLRFKIDEKSTRTVRKLLDGSTTSARELNAALRDVSARISSMQARGGFIPGSLTAQEKDLLNVFAQLQMRIKGTSDVAKVFGKNVQKSLQGVAASGKAASEAYSNTSAAIDHSNSRLLTLIKNSARLIALHSASTFIRNVREVTAEFELQRVALGGIIQDTAQANLLFRQIKAAAIESPFQIKDLVSYTKQLSAYRVETENLFDVTTRLADVSAGLGVDMSRLILAYGQVRAASVLRGQELRQFTEAGIPLVDLLAKKFTELNGRMVSTAEVFDLISKRAVPFEMISDIFEEMTDKGGTFYKMQEKQAETLAGQWSNLKDAVSIMYDEIGNTSIVHNAMSGMINDLKLLMQNWRTIATILKTVGAQYLSIKVASLFLPILTQNTKLAEKADLAKALASELETLQQQKSNAVRGIAIKQLDRYSKQMMKAASAQTMFGRGARQIAAWFTGGGWVGLIVSAMSVLVGWFISARQEANRLNKELEKIGSEGSAEINRSVLNFKRLADSAVEAADGSNEQNKALEELKRTYSDIIPEQNLQIDTLRELKGNYDSLTSAIEQKINMQIREQKVNAIQDDFAKRITKSRRSSKELLLQYGLDKEQINAVLDEVQNAIRDGLIGIESTVEERYQFFKNTIKNLTGIVVDFGNGYRDYAGNWVSVTSDRNGKAVKSLLSLFNVYADLNEEVKDVNREMESQVGSMGVYAKSWEDLQKAIKNVTVSEEEFGDKFTFSYKKEKVREQVSLMSKAIEEAFADTGIDISDAFKTTGLIDFKSINEAASRSNKWGLQGYIRNIQKSYESIVPTNAMVSVVERKFQELAKAVGLSMDDVQGYLLRGEKDMTDYAKEISSALEQAQYAVINLQKQEEDFKAHPGVAMPVSDKDMSKAEQMVTFFTMLTEWLKAYSKSSSGRSSQTDPFITQMQNRIKFMQDFKRGYDDLSKYMARSGALEKESEIMLGRGTSLGLSADDQKRAAEDLSQWYEEMIDVVSSRLRSKGVSGASVTDLLSIDTTKQSKTIQDLQKLLQQLWDAKTDFDTTTFKKNIEDELKRVSDEIKRSETARNFYQNILDLTGDEELAATMGISVYGGIGAEFKDRMQAQLNKALSTLDAGALTEELMTAVAGQDFDVILKNLDKFPEEWQKRLKEMAADSQKFEADRIAGLFKALQSAKTYGEKRVELAKQTAKRTAEIESLNIPQANKDSLLAQNTRKEAEEAAKLQYEAFKDTPMYVELFADLDAASSRMLRNMQGQLESMKENWKDLHPRELKELQSRLSEIYQQLALRNPFKALIDSIKEYNSLRKTMGRRDAENASIEADETVRKEKDKLNAYTQEFEVASRLYKKDDERYKMAKRKMEAQQKIVDASIEEAEAAQNTANQYRAVKQQILEAGEGLMKWKGYLDDSLSAIGDLVDTFGSSDTSEMFDIISGGISKTVGGAANLAMGIGSGNPVQILQGISGIVTGIAKTVQDIKIKKIDNDIEHQQHLLEELEYSYGRLEKTMEKSFGSDYIYNYNKQLETLVAKQAAYEEQARLEREKGKKADEDKIRDYENSARDVADQIMDMRSQLSEFFTGTDLSSAAQDFADAWIEAYKEFSSTTDAMSEKFNDMIQNMISRSLAAKVMQEMLQPIFDQIDTLSKDGLLSTEDIAEVAALAQERIPMINEAMTNLMTSLAAAGYDVKTQTAGLSGISKGYATASEESILGLAAAVNTQNFYISYVPTISENVAQILAAMTGGVSATSPALTNENGDVIPSVQQMVYDHLPNMDQNLSEMLRLFRSVVTTKNASTNTAYVAVK